MSYRDLPQDFVRKMEALLGGEAEEYRRSFEEPQSLGLRVNSLKIAPDDFRRLAAQKGWELTPVPWAPAGYYYGDGLRPARHPWYFAGLYYLQEPSAMAPAAFLPVEPGDRVLDLCAAPGGKSTALAARLEGQGLLFSNDISNSRARALLKNLELFGAANICVASETPERLAQAFPGFFNRILVDAPCSGEGMFRRDPEMIKSYREKGPAFYLPIQQAILRAAVEMLAPGGLLLYSTCTFDREENEGNILRLLEEYPQLSLVPLPREGGLADGIDLPGALRLFPHRIRGEGHFLALLEKQSASPAGAAAGRKSAAFAKANADRKPAALNDAAADFVNRIRRPWEAVRFHMEGERLYYLPEGFSLEKDSPFRRLRYLRTGLFLGEMKRDRFEPSQALAMHLKAQEWEDCLSLSSEDQRTIRYLKGETLSLEAGETGKSKGWRLVLADGFPLGWARGQGQILKNKYYPGWRWQ